MPELLKLTDDNYFSKEADMQYMSVSQFKSFLTAYDGCEAKAIAKLNGLYKEPDSTALLVGSYFHAHFEGTLDKFKEQHPEIFTKQGTLKSQYQQANDMINCLESDDTFQQLYQGEKEKIITFNLFDIPWKAKIDLLNLDLGYFIDLKTVRDFEDVWNNELHAKVSFIQNRGYNLQITAYREAIKQAFNLKDIKSFIIAVSKETPPGKQTYTFNQDNYDYALQIIQDHIDRIIDLKSGKEEPIRCEHCDYCRSTQTLEDVILYRDIY